MAGTISLASYMARIELDQSGLNVGLDQANRNIQDSLGKSMEASFKSLGSGMDKVGKSMSKISIPLIGLGVAAGKVGMDFQAGMSEVGAISQASAADMELLTEKAKEMGATTKFSAKNHWHTTKKLVA